MEEIVLPSSIARILLEITKSNDLRSALLRLIHDYIRLKLDEIACKIKKFEEKYGMTFEEFVDKIKRGEFGNKAFSFEIERDFWEWESLVTLKKYYETLWRKWVTQTSTK